MCVCCDHHIASWIVKNDGFCELTMRPRRAKKKAVDLREERKIELWLHNPFCQAPVPVGVSIKVRNVVFFCRVPFSQSVGGLVFMVMAQQSFTTIQF